jgi:hypothetical protein
VKLVNLNRRHFATLIAAASSALLFQCIPAYPSQVRYSWSGRLVPAGDDDPWLIHQQGEAFDLSVTVSSGALDLSQFDVEFAAFEVDNAQLFVQGQEIAYLGNGVLDFTDNSAVGYDLIVFAGDFQQFEQVIEIDSAVILLPDTFQFLQQIHQPPYFSSTANTLRITCCGGPYASIVAEGATVTVVPEPPSLALLPVTALLFVFANRPRRNLYPPSQS